MPTDLSMKLLKPSSRCAICNDIIKPDESYYTTICLHCATGKSGKRNHERVLSALQMIISAVCETRPDGSISSMGCEIYANAMLVLAENGRMVIEHEGECKIAGRWV